MDRKYYLLHLPAITALVDLVALARSRWPIEQQYPIRRYEDDKVVLGDRVPFQRTDGLWADRPSRPSVPDT